MKKFEGYMRGINLGGWLSQCAEYSEKHYSSFIDESPYRFTYDSVGETRNALNFDDSCAAEIETLFQNLDNTFISKGIPVIITEYGAVAKKIGRDWGTTNDEEVAKWTSYYVSTAEKYGIPCVWWDNGYHTSGNELFGIFNRKELSRYTPEVVEAIMDSLTK